MQTKTRTGGATLMHPKSKRDQIVWFWLFIKIANIIWHPSGIPLSIKKIALKHDLNKNDFIYKSHYKREDMHKISFKVDYLT